MNYDELVQLNKEVNKLNILRYVTLPISIIFGIIFFFVVIFALTVNIAYGTIAVVLWIAFIVLSPIFFGLYNKKYWLLYRSLEDSILETIGIDQWEFNGNCDATVMVKSSQAVDKYDDIKYFKEHEGELLVASSLMKQKHEYARKLTDFLDDNEYVDFSLYPHFRDRIINNLRCTEHFFIIVSYVSPAGRKSNTNCLKVSYRRIKELENDKSILMSKSEYNKYLKEQEKELLDQKHHSYYERVNGIIDYANVNKDRLVIRSDVDELDKLIASLFDRTVNSIKKIKSRDSEEWDVLDKFISNIDESVKGIVDKNNQILEYYESEEFTKIKTTCATLMDTQREFNEYIDEKVKSISSLFGTNVVRNETEIEDEYNYIHPYKKSITPFTAEVSANVFASAENSPLDYIVKNFYPNKSRYPEQIQKLHTLIEELETLREAKQIIENYKAEVQQYITEVPDFVMDNDEDGFYSRLGFATINENTLVVAYKFSYTSNGGKAQRSFTVPMTEDTIVELIKMLESKLTMTAFSKEQRSLMTSKLRQAIKERDDYTCKICGNSTHVEPNLLLEIDHIIPVAKGGCTEESNLQTLCWKCNRHKSAKIV